MTICISIEAKLKIHSFEKSQNWKMKTFTESMKKQWLFIRTLVMMLKLLTKEIRLCYEIYEKVFTIGVNNFRFIWE